MLPGGGGLFLPMPVKVSSVHPQHHPVSPSASGTLHSNCAFSQPVSGGPVVFPLRRRLGPAPACWMPGIGSRRRHPKAPPTKKSGLRAQQRQQ